MLTLGMAGLVPTFIGEVYAMITGRPRVPTVFSIVGDEAHGILPDGSIVMVSKEDLPIVEEYHWRRNPGGYAETHFTVDGKYKRFFMHRMLLGISGDDWRKVQVDHKDRNKLNNTRKNLRKCTNSENQINRQLRSDNTSGYTGVEKEGKRWSVRMCGERLKGTYATKEEAFEVRKKAEVEKYGQFSRFYEEYAV